jgi:PadR family transcriptional regulator, regulatory protein PadR
VVSLAAISALQVLRLNVSLFPAFVIAHLCVLCALWITIIECSQLTPIFAAYMALQYMASPVPDRELKKGSAELMILALLEDRARHGYEIGQLIELRSRGAIRFNVASLYPLLYRLEKRNWIRGRWIEKAGQRRRRYYRLTASGKNVLSKQRAGWREFVEAINLITGIQHA